jgi:hypothetical protein
LLLNTKILLTSSFFGGCPQMEIFLPVWCCPFIWWQNSPKCCPDRLPNSLGDQKPFSKHKIYDSNIFWRPVRRKIVHEFRIYKPSSKELDDLGRFYIKRRRTLNSD